MPRCDYWICYDMPMDAHKMCAEAFRTLRPTVVTLPNYADRWIEWMSKDLGYGYHEMPSLEIADYQPLWYETAIKVGPRYSSTLAPAWALQRRFTAIHYVGCDLGGSGYCHHDATAALKKKSTTWTNRWARERRVLRAAQDALKARGYSLTGLPWDPPRDPSEPD
jgi:hypothetical protein